ncbi:MAG: IS110 family transposase [Nitrospirota bacterium]
MKLYAGVDLHSNNNYLGIIDQKDKRVYKKKLPNALSEVLKELEPYRKELEGVAVESTFNWYWLVDGLMENGYKVHLANPCAIKQYDGLKHSDDTKESFHLAHLLKLGILPEGYIYPKEERPVRDLLRKRLLLVRHKTAYILSFQNLVSRTLGTKMNGDEVEKLKEEGVEKIFGEKNIVLAGKANIAAMRFLLEKIKEIEKAVLQVAKLKGEYKKLLTVPGIGKILALTIMYETGEIKRFPEVGNYASYCRCVGSTRFSNGKQKGTGNRKNGNKYLSWAYVEAANFAIWSYPYIKKYYQKKMSKTNKIVAIKTVAHKLARASYYVMKDQEVFVPKKAFG